MGTRALAVLLLAAPWAALGQTAGVLTATPPDVGRDACSTQSVGLAWTGSAAPGSGLTQTWRLAVYLSTDTCPTTAPALANALLAADTTAVAGTSSASVSVSSSVIASKGTVTCVANPGPAAADAARKICVFLVTNPGTSETSSLAAQGPFTFQLARPPPPVLVTVDPANGALVANFQAGAPAGLDTATSASYQVRAYLGTALVSTATGTSSGIRVGGLANTNPPTSYTVKVVALSRDGNLSDESNGVAQTPLPFIDFWTAYQAAGGHEQGGCGGGAGALSLLALLPLWLRRRRP